MKRIAVLVSNDLTHDQRVRKTCEVLAAQGLEITLVGRILPGSEPIKRKYETVRLRLPFLTGVRFYASLQRGMLNYLRGRIDDWDAIWCNDLDTLWPGWMIARAERIPIIYDSHEYFTEAAGLTGRPFPKMVWTLLERRIFPKLRYVFTVNQSIADIYRKKYNVRVRVLRNVPFRNPKGIRERSRKELKLPEGKLAILQGAFMDKDRGVLDAVKAMKLLPDVHLLLVGAGEEWEKAHDLRDELGLQKQITILPKQPYEKLAAMTRVADVGLSLDKGVHFNYYYSLPNKLFDYIHAKTPVVVSPLPEVRRVAEEYGVGKVIEDWTEESIASAINEVLETPKEKWEEGLHRAAEECNWEAESQKIIDVLEELGLAKSASSNT